MLDDVLFENVRSRLASALVEANALSPVISFRILGQSALIERPNTYLWAVTSNGTEASPDLISRGVPIRLFFEGDPKRRDYSADVIELALQHRLEILGELAGMVQRWVQGAYRLAGRKHRCRRWAAAIGGILDVAGLGDHFLANSDEAAGEMDESLRELAALAAHVAQCPDTGSALRRPGGRGRVRPATGRLGRDLPAGSCPAGEAGPCQRTQSAPRSSASSSCEGRSPHHGRDRGRPPGRDAPHAAWGGRGTSITTSRSAGRTRQYAGHRPEPGTEESGIPPASLPRRGGREPGPVRRRGNARDARLAGRVRPAAARAGTSPPDLDWLTEGRWTMSRAEIPAADTPLLPPVGSQLAMSSLPWVHIAVPSRSGTRSGAASSNGSSRSTS